jgi:hypothetical protein
MQCGLGRHDCPHMYSMAVSPQNQGDVSPPLAKTKLSAVFYNNKTFQPFKKKDILVCCIKIAKPWILHTILCTLIHFLYG